MVVLNTSVGLRKENDQESALMIAGYINRSQIERDPSPKRGAGLWNRDEKEP